MSNKNKLFGMKLKLIRVKKDLSQMYCAYTIKCSLRTWSRWECGEAFPRPVYHDKILEILPELAKI